MLCSLRVLRPSSESARQSGQNAWSLRARSRHCWQSTPRRVRPSGGHIDYNITALLRCCSQIRFHGGFLTVVSVASSLEAPSRSQSDSDTGIQEEQHLRLSLLSSILTVLSRSFEGNLLNRHTFSSTIGFTALGEAIKLSNLLTLDNINGSNDKLFGILLAFILDQAQERSAKELFVNLRELQETTSIASGASREENSENLLTDQLDNFLGFPAQLVNPEGMSILLSFVHEAEPLRRDKFLRRTVLLLLDRLSGLSRRNRIIVAQTGLLDSLLDWLFSVGEDPKEKGKASQGVDGQLLDEERAIVTSLAESLLLLGASTRNLRHIAKRVMQDSDEDQDKQTLDMPMLRFL